MQNMSSIFAFCILQKCKIVIIGMNFYRVTSVNTVQSDTPSAHNGYWHLAIKKRKALLSILLNLKMTIPCQHKKYISANR